MDWKGILEKIVIAVVAGAILGIAGYFVNKALSPALQPIEARLSWVQTDNPIQYFSPRLEEETNKALEKAYGIAGLAEFTQRAARRASISVARLEFVNSSDVRSKEVEVSLFGGLLYSDAASEKVSQVRSELKLKPIEPRGKVEVLAVLATAGHQYFSPFSNLKALHNDRQVEIVSLTLGEELMPLGLFAANYPFVLLILASVGGFTIFMLMISIVIALITHTNVRRMAKYTNDAQLRGYAQIIEYVQKNHYDRWEKLMAMKAPYPEDVKTT